MKKLQCELCNGIEITKINNDTFQCQHCGCKYTLEQAKKLIISGSVETTIGDAEFRRLVENAKTQLKFKQDPSSTIDKIIHEFPARYDGYYLYLINFFTVVFSKKSFNIDWNSAYNNYQILLKIANNSLEESTEKVNKLWNNNIKLICDKIIEGKETFDDFGIDNKIIDLISQFKNIYNIGLNNARLLRENDLHGNPGYITTDGYKPTFVLGKKFVGMQYCYGNDNVFTLNNSIGIITPEDIPRLKKEASANSYIYAYNNEQCPLCHHRIYQATFSKKLVCDHCGSKYKPSK